MTEVIRPSHRADRIWAVYRANALDFGELESVHPFSRAWGLRFAIIAGVCIALGIVLAVWMTDGLAPHNHRSFSSAVEQWAVSLVVGGTLIAVGLVLLTVWWVGTTTRASIFERGLVYERLGRSTSIRWDDVARFWRSERIVNGVEHYRYILEDRSGRRLTISRRLARVREVGRRIEIELRRHRLPEALAAHAGGARLLFGKVAVTSVGLNRGASKVRWLEIDAVHIDGGYVTVWKPGASAPWLRLRLWEVPNVDILLQVLATHIRVVR